MDDKTALCTGCARTREEIARWSRMTGPERAAVCARLPERQSALATLAMQDR
jgi:predicted Fe-S protein YdhL (DUF1289 family)